jgi:WD40 repeat protein
VFSPDGKLLAGVSGTDVRLWDLTTGEPFGAPLPTGGFVRQIQWAPDGRTLASLGIGPTPVMLRWDLDPASWAAQACAIANRNLTQSEWDRLVGSLAPYRETCPAL